MPLWTILTKWPGTDRPDMGVAALGGEREEDRLATATASSARRRP